MSIAINHLLPFNGYTVDCGIYTFHLSAVLTLLSGVLITAVMVDCKRVMSISVDYVG